MIPLGDDLLHARVSIDYQGRGPVLRELELNTKQVKYSASLGRADPERAPARSRY